MIRRVKFESAYLSAVRRGDTNRAEAAHRSVEEVQMPRVTVWLDDKHVTALGVVALAERRRPADQAAVLLEEALAKRTQTAETKEAAMTA
jgi:hypothetical protein